VVCYVESTHGDSLGADTDWHTPLRHMLCYGDGRKIGGP